VARGTAVPLNRTERILAFILAAIAGITVLDLVVLLIGRVAGADFTQGVWPVVAVLPGIGLPLLLIALVVFIVLMVLRSRRLAADDARQ
jgi:membrane protein DedA with SNARE-associated domain